MVGAKVILKRGGRDEAEKPFWISFADLMTALMVLFLVVMGVALLAVTKNVTEREKKEEQHRRDIELILDRFEQAAKRYDGIKVDALAASSISATVRGSLLASSTLRQRPRGGAKAVCARNSRVGQRRSREACAQASRRRGLHGQDRLVPR